MKIEYLVLELLEVKEGVKIFFPNGSDKITPNLGDMLNFFSNEGWRLSGLHPKRFEHTHGDSLIPKIIGHEVIRYWLILEREIVS